MTAAAPPAAGRLGTPESRRAFRRYWITEPLDGLWKAALHHSMRLMPIAVCSALGAPLGRLLGRTVHRGMDARARRNYLWLQPEASPEQLERAMQAMWSNLGRTMAELSAIERLWTSGRVAVTGAEHLLAAQRARRPFIVACLHLANWELTGIGLVSLGLECCSVFEPTGTRFDVRLMTAARARLTKRHPIYPPGKASAHAIYDAVVRRRQGLHIHIDEPFKGQVNAPSLGRPLPIRGNIVNAVRLALVADAFLIPAYAERVGDGARFKLVYEAPFALLRSGDKRTDIRTNVERLDAHIGALIRERLEQWRLLGERLFDE
ncbi:MAG: lysophospholipid acyltransferase family protein [Steroidobacteraceae bacterium]